jgi:hypothetical protein
MAAAAAAEIEDPTPGADPEAVEVDRQHRPPARLDSSSAR